MSESRCTNLSASYATALRKASRRVTQFYDKAMAPGHLKSTQYAILAELNGWQGQAPPTIALLAEQMVMDRSSLSRSLALLERDGLVTVEQGAGDRRERRVTLTGAGDAKYWELLPLWQRAQEQFLSAVGTRESACLYSLLISVTRNERLLPR